MRIWPATSRSRLNLWLILAIFLLFAVTLEIWSQVTAFRFFRARLMSLCDAAIGAYDQRGAAGLSSMTETARMIVGIQIRVLGAEDGRDLADGSDRSRLLTEARQTAWPGPLRKPSPLLLKTVKGKACLATPETMPVPIPPGMQIWALLFVCLSCCGIAVYVTVRSRRLEVALTQFGAGQLGFRMRPGSGDPLSRLSARFNEMADRIELLVRANQRLGADISHELRTPLTRMRLSTQMAREGVPGALDRIDREAERIDELLGELLDISRAEADTGSLRPERLVLEAFLNEIVDECRIEAEAKECSIVVSAPPSLCIQGDPDLLRRAVDNILRNAIRHSPPDSPIHVTAEARDGMVIAGIRDFGPGVPEEFLERIFAPFYKVDLDCGANQGGTGLGLALAKRAIEVQGGKIQARNCHPGLAVEIRLPMAG